MDRVRSTMILPVLFAALAATAPLAEEAQPFATTASEWLLSGQGLPRDYRLRLMRMDSADRLQAIAYLRRIGLLTERPWALEDLLRPAEPAPELAE